jgi:hypothetical protein
MYVSSLVCAGALSAIATATTQVRRQSDGTTFTVYLAQTYQTVDGFGFSKAFQRANFIVDLPAPKQREVLDFSSTGPQAQVSPS